MTAKVDSDLTAFHILGVIFNIENNRKGVISTSSLLKRHKKQNYTLSQFEYI